MDDEGRDIDLVLVTGAGASTAFGKDGGRVPMMAEWSEALIRSLGTRDSSYLAATGLTPGLSGPEFEERLGAFLRSVLAFSEIEPLLEPSLQMQRHDRIFLEGLKQWHGATVHHLGEVTSVIHESLYENFGFDAVDLEGAVSGYQTLFRQLGVVPGASFLCATTNYDVIAEHALRRLGFHPDWGDVPALQRGDADLHVENIIDGMPRYVPVLHLHGRVGWYRRTQDERLMSTEGLAKFGPFGVPIVMLPDPEKDYDSDPAIQALWPQFEAALARARRVFVLGHSLHDDALVAALRRHVQPARRLAVAVMPAPRGVPDPGAEVIELVNQEFSGARIVRVRFQQEPDIESGVIDDWMASLSR